MVPNRSNPGTPDEKASSPSSKTPGAVAVSGSPRTSQEQSRRDATLPHDSARIKRLEQELVAKQRGLSNSTLPGAYSTSATATPASGLAKLRKLDDPVHEKMPAVTASPATRMDPTASDDASSVRLDPNNNAGWDTLQRLDDQVSAKMGRDMCVRLGGPDRNTAPPVPTSLRAFGAHVEVKTRDASFDSVESLPGAEAVGGLWHQASGKNGPARRVAPERTGDPIFGAARSRLYDETDASGNDVLKSERDESDLEFGVHDNHHSTGAESVDSDTEGLARAIVVHEDDAFVPSAVEYDPDTKPPIRVTPFRWYAALALVATVAGLAGTVTGLWISMSSTTVPPALADRSVIGIRETIAPYVVGPSVDQQLDDVTNPYRQALDWIQYVDTMALTVDSHNLIQRFLLAYMYYSTSVQQPWSNDCNAHVEGESETCQLEIISLDTPGKSRKIPAMRWMSPVNECQWAGIECDTIGQVVDITIVAANVTGGFPEGLSGLPFWRSLSLAQGELTGTLPSVAHNKHLTTIVLRDNRFDGSIPDSWYHLRMLHDLDLSMNQLTGSLSSNVSQWKNMREMLLSENSLSGSIPNQLGNLVSLEKLRLNNNQLVGSLPLLGNLRHTIQLWLHRNQLTGSIATEIGQMALLNDLRLHVNQLNGSIPEELFRIPDMSQLDLYDNQFLGALSTAIGNWVNMYSIRIENNGFVGTIPTQVGMLKELQEFIASGNAFEGSVPNRLCSLLDRDQNVQSRKALEVIQVDCLVVPPDSTAEIACPVDCCTLCCDANGNSCQVPS